MGRDGLLDIVVFDAFKGSSGPFTLEVAKPHVSMTMSDVDFDANNLCVDKDYVQELSMRLPHPGLT